jgi:hypothetical protein
VLVVCSHRTRGLDTGEVVQRLRTRPDTPSVARRTDGCAGSRRIVEHRPPGSGPPSLGLVRLADYRALKGTRSQGAVFATMERLGDVLEAGPAREYLSGATSSRRRARPEVRRVVRAILDRHLWLWHAGQSRE